MKYEILRNWKKSNNPYNWQQGCHLCKKPFAEDEEFTRVDVDTNGFRGDDEVYCFHKSCNWNEKDLKE